MEKMREYADKANELVIDMKGVEGVGYNLKDITIYHNSDIDTFEVMEKLSELPVDKYFQNVGKLNLERYG